jgi:hypothetical protein
LPFGKTEIFLQKGLDSFLLICPISSFSKGSEASFVPRMLRSAPQLAEWCAAKPARSAHYLGSV